LLPMPARPPGPSTGSSGSSSLEIEALLSGVAAAPLFALDFEEALAS